MKNAKWYLLCDFEAKKALDLTQLPDVWRNITGLSDMSDSCIADLSWSENPMLGFLPIETAKNAGIDEESIDRLIDICKPSVDNWVRSMRDPLLAATDVVTVSDRWAALDVVAQARISNYRQALRDITLQDGFSVVWPAIPDELSFIRLIDVSNIERPSESFIYALTGPDIVYTKEQLQNDQWLRIRAERERRKAGGVKLNINQKDYWFWTDETSRCQYAILADSARRRMLPDVFFLTNWKTMTGEFVAFTVGTLHQVIDAGIQAENSLFNIAENKRSMMLTLDDPTSYDWKTGWPENYEEWQANNVSTK